MATQLEEPVPARFRLLRHEDTSGVSGTGVVAYGMWLPTGLVALGWNSDKPTLTAFQRLSDVIDIHGHDGATCIDWIDPDPFTSAPPAERRCQS